MNTERMERIIFVAEVGNITEAAALLHISQPSLSQMIHAEEEEIGAPIFNRKQQPLTLTNTGELYIRAAHNIIRQINNFNNNLANYNEGFFGKIRIGVSHRRSIQIMPIIMPELVQKYPNISYEIIDNSPLELARDLRQGKIDIYLGGYAINDDSITCKKICTDHILLIASKKSTFYKNYQEYEYLGGESDIRIPITAAKDEDFLLLRKRTAFRDICDNIFAISNMHPRIRAEFDSTSMAFSMLSAFPCVAMITAILPNNYSLQSLEYPDIAFFRFSPLHQNPTLYMGYNREINKTPAELALITAIEQHFTDTSLF